MSTSFVLPGDTIPQSLIPPTKSGQIKLSRGLLPSTSPDHQPSGVTSTLAGTLTSQTKKPSIALHPLSPGGRYIPAVNDLIIAQIHHSATDFYHCYITPHTSYALLPHLAFEGATRKNRPHLAANALVYAKVVRTEGGEVELSCVNPATGKAEGMGPLVGGGVFEISLVLARRLMLVKPREQGGVAVLEELGEMLMREGRGGFETAVGRNGRVWVDSGKGVIRTVILVGRCLREMDEKNLAVKEQKTLVDRLVKGKLR